jgi:MFS family permease
MTSVAPFLTENSDPEQRAILFTLDSGLMNAASFVTSIVGGYLPGFFALLLRADAESTAAYRSVLLVAVGAMLLAALPILTLKETGDRRPTAKARFSLRIRGHFPNPGRMVQLVLPRMLMAFGAGLVFPFLNLFFKERFAVSDASLGWIFGITNIFAAAAMLGGGVVAERLGKLQAMLYARLLSLPGLVIIGFVPVLPIAVAAHWLRSGLMRLGEPLYMAFAMEQLGEEERATGSSLLSTGWNVGWSIGPFVSGLLQPHVGWEALFVGTVLFYTTSLVCTYQFFMRPSKKGRGTAQT